MSDLYSAECGCNASKSRVSEIYRHLTMADAPLAISYVPTQIWETPSEPYRGLKAGTIFQSLYKPFCGKGGLKQ